MSASKRRWNHIMSLTTLWKNKEETAKQSVSQALSFIGAFSFIFCDLLTIFLLNLK